MRCQDKFVVTRLNRDIAHRHRGKSTAFELRPGLSAVDRNPETEFGAEEKDVRLHHILLDHVRVTLDAGNFCGVTRGVQVLPKSVVL